MISIPTEKAETLARQLDANEPMVQDPVAIEFFGDVAAALRSVAADRDAAIARAEKAEAEAEKLREAFRSEREENLWNAFNVGSIRGDGKWIDCGMSDAEWLIREIGMNPDANGYDPEEIKRRIPLAAERTALNQRGADGGEKAKRHHHDGIPDGLLMRGG